MISGRMNVDSDGFLVSDDAAHAGLKVAPSVVAVPKFFDGCRTTDEAVSKMIDELSKPFSIEMEGHDELYRRLANALILLLANQAGLTP